eukprot:jgi/Hompol1/5729/HPOL_004657-RA
MSDINQIAKSFVDFYYSTFDRNRAELAPLYKPISMLTFEGQQHAGAAIVEKLVSLPFQRVQHQVATIDVQPSNPQAGSLLVTVTGRLLIDEETNPTQFSQTFQLIAEGSSYFVFNGTATLQEPSEPCTSPVTVQWHVFPRSSFKDVRAHFAASDMLIDVKAYQVPPADLTSLPNLPVFAFTQRPSEIVVIPIQCWFQCTVLAHNENESTEDVEALESPYKMASWSRFDIDTLELAYTQLAPHLHSINAPCHPIVKEIIAHSVTRSIETLHRYQEQLMLPSETSTLRDSIDKSLAESRRIISLYIQMVQSEYIEQNNEVDRDAPEDPYAMDIPKFTLPASHPSQNLRLCSFCNAPIWN